MIASSIRDTLQQGNQRQLPQNLLFSLLPSFQIQRVGALGQRCPVPVSPKARYLPTGTTRPEYKVYLSACRRNAATLLYVYREADSRSLQECISSTMYLLQGRWPLQLPFSLLSYSIIWRNHNSAYPGVSLECPCAAILARRFPLTHALFAKFMRLKKV